MNKMSYLMLSGLIATSFLTVNCQKSPSKRGIKSKTSLENIDLTGKPDNKATATDSKATAADKKNETAKLQACTDETKAMIIDLKTLGESTKVLAESEAGKSESSKEEILQNRKSIVEKCDAVVADLAKYTEQSCVAGEQAISTKIILEACMKNGEELKKENNTDNKYAVQAEKVERLQKSVDKLIGSEFILSDDGKVLLDVDALSFEKYVSKSGISYSSNGLDKILAAKDIACSFVVADTKDIQLGVETTMKLTAMDVEKTNIPEDFKGKATFFSFEAQQADSEKSVTFFGLVCLNVDSENLDITKLKSALSTTLKIKTAQLKSK